MPFIFRTAREEDAPVLAALNAAFNGDTGVSADDIRHSLEGSAEVVVLALHNSSPAGFCCAQVHHSFCYTAPSAEVTELYVADTFRRMGCAGGMLAFLEAYLRERFGADELHLLTGRANLPAQAAYRKAGFTVKDEVYMRKRLP